MAPYKKSREDGCCSVNFLKYVLFIFNFIFFLAGCAVFGVGLWSVLEKRYIELLTNDTYAVIAYLLIAAGVITILVSIIGCFGAVRENRCILLLYTFLLLLIFLMEAVAGIMAYVYEDQAWHELETNMNKTLTENYMFDIAKTDAIDDMQRQYKCCGAFSHEDWQYSKWQKSLSDQVEPHNLVPESCCISKRHNCGSIVHPSNIYAYNGCIDSFVQTNLQKHLIILGAVGLGVCIIQIFGMIFSCCLYVKLKDFEYDY
uniref:Tetraspanin n=1 Tax=Strigamia maritima TaxID=126957 RepID=T1JK25_STRMM